MVVCVDEKSQIQALDRTAPMLPILPGMPRAADPRLRPQRHHHAVRRARGRHRPDQRACLPRHRHQEFLRFLKQVAKAYPRVQLHLVCDNYATHKHPAVKAWLARNPRITLHFTPTSGSWLNLVEIFFGIITRQAIRRGTFDSVRDLIDAITSVHRRLERTLPTVRLDQGRRHDHRQSHTVNQLPTRDTSTWCRMRNVGQPRSESGRGCALERAQSRG